MQAPPATTATRRLFFAVVGEGTVASVSVKDDDAIEDLKAAIAQKRRYDFPSDELTLFTTKRTVANEIQWLASRSADSRALQKSPVLDELKQRFLDMEHELDPASVVSDFFTNAPQTHTVHVLVLLPEHFRASQSRKRSPESLDATSDALENDFTPNWKNEFRKTYLCAEALPPVTKLAAFVDEELPVKIPLTSATLTPLRRSVNKELLNKLFVEDDDSPCTQYYRDVVLPTLEPFDIDGHSEASFITYWDTLIARPLRLTGRGLTFNRDTNRNSSTAMKRPDFVCTLNGVCVFRGEEKDGDTSIDVPQQELQSKLIWSYGSAPYILAYATSGKDCNLYALVAANGRSVVSVQLASFKTKDDTEDRLRLLLAMLQLVRLFDGIVVRTPDTARDEFRRIDRPNGVIVELSAESVEKRFPQDERWAHIRDHLKQVYQVIQSHNIPNTDRLVKAKKSALDFVFTPRGTDMRPKTLGELFTAIGQVLECLVALHDAEWMHRDLRWDNVLKRRDVPNQWFVIDFVDAATSPKQNSGRLETLNNSNHAPEIFIEDGSHTTAVDVWGVGLLIDTCELAKEWCAMEARDEFLTRLLAKDPAQRPSASEALVELRSLRAASSR